LTLRRLNGQTLKCEVPFADELSALVLKSLATKVRFKDTDMADIWRCLEVAFAAELRPTDFAKGIRADAAEVIRTLGLIDLVVGCRVAWHAVSTGG
jgi:hypothetical protein